MAAGKTPLRVLFVEDSEDDAALIAIELRRGGYEVSATRVETADATRDAMAGPRWDVVISDYNLPGFGGLEALRIVRETDPDVPFVLVSGVIGEEVAVEAMKSGAHDYVLKGNLRRLGPAIAREVRDAGIREAQRRDAVANRFLSRAGAALAASLEGEHVLGEVVALAVPDVAHLCALEIADDERRLALVAMSLPEPASSSGLPRASPPDGPRPGLDDVLRTGRTLRGSLSDPSFAARVAPPVQAARMLELGLDSFLAVPLVARGENLGILWLARRPPAVFAPEDEPWIEEVGRRCALALANARLHEARQEALRVRDEFLSVVSHELKNPLLPLLLQVELIERSLRGEPSAARLAKHFTSAKRQVHRLVQLIDNLLDTSRIATGRLTIDPQPLDLVALVRELVERYRPEAAHVGSTLDLVTSEPLLAGSWDPVRLDEVIGNLMSNAIKFGSGRPIRVTLARTGDRVRLCVSDQGIGLQPEDRERIFERFTRAASTRDAGGMGIGLYVVRQIVEAHGGNVRVDSEPGAGSTFVVDLPRVAPGAREEKRAPQPGTPA